MLVRAAVLLALLALLAVASPLAAVQVQELSLISPLTGKRFTALATPASRAAIDTRSLADMGSDDDGCRHSSNLSEYERYVVIDPTSFFTALAVEWDDRSGRFIQPLPPEVRQWVEKRFAGELATDLTRAFAYQQKLRAAQNLPPLDRDQFTMGQDSVPVERRFAYAIECYERRGARSSVLAKLALTGAWALRARFQLPVSDPRLAGGFEEINDRVVRQIKDGEQFSLEKWYGIYKEIAGSSRLTPSGAFVAGQTLFGFAVRRGDRAEATAILEGLTERFKPNRENNDGFEFQRGLVRTMRREFTEYLALTQRASVEFRRAIAAEEFARPRLPEIVLAIAESLRRSGDREGACDWYRCLAQMAETQPKLRSDIRAEGKAPGASAPYHVQLGWLADRHVAALVASGVPDADSARGPDKGLINAILFEGLGTLEYVNPAWKPITGAEARDSAFVLDLLGKHLLMHEQRFGEYPVELGELWMTDPGFDRNRVNRFHCPVTGAAYLYAKPAGQPGPKTVLVATAEPVATPEGKRFAAFLANNTVVWSELPFRPGEASPR